MHFELFFCTVGADTPPSESYVGHISYPAVPVLSWPYSYALSSKSNRPYSSLFLFLVSSSQKSLAF